jgi:hypothetical protein
MAVLNFSFAKKSDISIALGNSSMSFSFLPHEERLAHGQALSR